MDKLAIEFEEELRSKMIEAKKTCGYNPTRFNQMLSRYGGVETARRLIANAQKKEIRQRDFPHYGLTGV